ncbi:MULTISPECIES: acyl-CoA dehydrogenase family protein [Aeromicrobium]|uniref:Acyl-CoA dehydrogenase family protein n=2 Tax=Aeromicrobium TaxID=2040 RepID=A0A8I0EVH1_9ACTN|nr:MULTISPECIES: acyl-CoA dehydrogenase family protein [Aeromicrobium]MBC9226294.1 acyl-CoA dehydrogenase family protein [Aeromicrobium senzhongii]MCD9154603.1 acyl-CoA dehydrogenase family protein [Aeromicrobium duanguangcaii]MCL3838721.1 acyl-CoA dehydrogenase family protein [Aeromicrobium duanguangcaii]MCQ3998400.1 acyl-CoA dehydrogenase [Aeromicrobium sp. 636]MTB88829.1 acyl-CoA dehydrogenase [Aeromicrobium senzhongii]
MDRTIYSADHEDFRASCAAFLDKHARPFSEEFVSAKAFPREFWTAAGAEGFLGLEIPEEFGGAGAGDFRFNAVLAEELSKITAALASCVGIHTDIATPYIVDLGTQEQKERWLPGCADGTILTAIGMTEPSGGSDLAALRTTAVRDGDQWVINGSKTFITNGFSADLVLTAVRTSPEKGAKGITLFAIEATDEGFSRGRKLDKVGQEESDTAELFFENVRVGDDRVIGEVDRGFIYMMERLPQERLSCAVSNVAHAKQILLETIQYCHDRKAFGQSIGSLQHNKFLLAELVTQIEVAEAYVDAAVAAHAQRTLTSTDAAKAKWWSSQVQNEVLDHCVQLHGGYGFMNEYRVARAWRDARVTKIWAGSNEIMKELIGRDLGF